MRERAGAEALEESFRKWAVWPVVVAFSAGTVLAATGNILAATAAVTISVTLVVAVVVVGLKAGQKVHAADQRDYPLTLDEATNSGDRWSADDDAYVLDHLRDPAREVALELGRTLWAVRNRRVTLRKGRRKG